MKKNNKKLFSISQMLKLVGEEGMFEDILGLIEEGVIPTTPPEKLKMFDIPEDVKFLSFEEVFDLCLGMELSKIGIEDCIISRILELPELSKCVQQLKQHPDKNAILVYKGESLSDDPLTHAAVCDLYCTIEMGDDAEEFYEKIAEKKFLSHYVVDLAKIVRAILSK